MSLLWTRPRVLLLYLLAWQLPGLLLSAALVQALALSWDEAMRFALPLNLLYALLLPSAWEVSRSPRLGRSSGLLGLPLGASAAGAVGLLWLGAAWAWSVPTQLPPQGIGPALALSLWLLGSGGYLFALLLAQAVHANEREQEAQRRAEALQLRAREAELLMLRSQVNPHFLFNCLNSISALTAFDAGAARAMTLALAQYFRQTLALGQRRSITLEDELAHCRGYLEIEQQRFGERLQWQFDCSAEAAKARLAPMLLQPLVENAVKHGIAPHREGGQLQLRAQVREGWLHLQLDNPATADAAPAEGTGTGLSNVRQRLAALYGERARLSTQLRDGRFHAALSLPWTQEDDDEDPHPAGR